MFYFHFPRPNKRHIYATPLRSSYFVWLHYKRRYFPKSIPPMWLWLSVLQFFPRPDKTLVSVCITGTECVLTINVVQKNTCLNWMEQHISSPTHSKCLYLSFTQSRHVLLEITQFRYLPKWQSCKKVLLKSWQVNVKKKKKKKEKKKQKEKKKKKKKKTAVKIKNQNPAVFRLLLPL